MPDKEAEALINFINATLKGQEARPADVTHLDISRPDISDLDVELPSPRQRGEWVCGYKVEECTDETTFTAVQRKWERRWEPKPRPLPRPPYRCICGEKFATAEGLLAHRHHRKIYLYTVPRHTR
jgi:hypothetical protein